MKNGLYIGIDPGSNTGGVAYIRTYVGFPDEVAAVKISDLTEKMTWELFKNIIRETTIDAYVFCVIEKVHSMPGQGVSSSFKFGGNYFGLRMALIGNSIPFDECSPQRWIMYYGMKKKIIGTETDEKGKKENILEAKTDWKRRLRQKAEQLFPEVKMTNYIADALLIANYCKFLNK